MTMWSQSVLFSAVAMSVASTTTLAQNVNIFPTQRQQHPQRQIRNTSNVGQQQQQQAERKLQSCPAPPPAGPPPPIDLEILFIAAAIPALDAELIKYETPFALRFTNYFGAMWWNCIASYSTTYLDTLTNADPVVRVLDPLMHTTANRGACIVQTIATYNSLSLPGAQEGFFANIGGNNPFGLDVGAVTGIAFDDTLDPAVAACTDDACLQALAATANYDPKTMGHIVAKLAYDYSIEDGFNQLGTDNGCEVSCRAYRDPTGYAPVNDPWRLDNKKTEARWEPLLEDNGRGFFYRQEHVTPHIGQTAKFRVLPESDRTNRVAVPPGYSKRRIVESRKVIKMMRQLDDTKKLEVEVFDNKLIVANAVYNSFLGKLLGEGFVEPEPAFQKPGIVVSLERFVNFVSGALAAELDAGIIAWKEKVNYDMVRPTSIIKRMRGDITTWAPGGIQTFPAADFEAYKRVMPHAEYVSGSSCLFQVFEDYILDYMTGIGVSTVFPVTFDPIDVGESNVEPGLVPSSCIQLQYNSIEEMNEAGSVSRLFGGIHFEASVPNGQALCSGIGNIAAAAAFNLYSGTGNIIVV